MSTNPAMMAGVARDHVGLFCLSLGGQMCCASLDSPDVWELSQPFHKNLCTPILSSWFTGMQDPSGLPHCAIALGTHHSSCCHREGGNWGCPAPAQCSEVEQPSRAGEISPSCLSPFQKKPNPTTNKRRLAGTFKFGTDSTLKQNLIFPFQTWSPGWWLKMLVLQ